jgi:hypothetical protein
VITGFNTDIVHDGVTYHVQTEDKGLDSPLLLTLVYSGGAILASKRSPYDDLIAEGFSEKTLAERLQRQHKLICAAIRAGRIEELKLMTQREAGHRTAQKAERRETPPQPTVQSEPATVATADTLSQGAEPAPASEQPLPLAQGEQQPLAEQASPVLPFTPRTPPPPAFRGNQTPIIMRPAPPDDFVFAKRGGAEDELHLQLMDDRDFHAGDVVALRIRVSRGAGGEEDGVANASVTVKVLGTTFRPLICAATTDREGMAIVFATLPRFSSGRAAILIRVLAGSRDAEMRRIILPSK